MFCFLCISAFRFHATVYSCPDSPHARRQMSLDVMARLSDLDTVSELKIGSNLFETISLEFQVLKQSKEHCTQVLTAAAEHSSSWLTSVRKAKAIFHTLNLFNLDVTRKYLIAECWIPCLDLDDAQKALSRGTVSHCTHFMPK